MINNDIDKLLKPKVPQINNNENVFVSGEIKIILIYLMIQPILMKIL
jgi:hypothetical protein